MGRGSPRSASAAARGSAGSEVAARLAVTPRPRIVPSRSERNFWMAASSAAEVYGSRETTVWATAMACS